MHIKIIAYKGEIHVKTSTPLCLNFYIPVKAVIPRDIIALLLLPSLFIKCLCLGYEAIVLKLLYTAHTVNHLVPGALGILGAVGV